MAGVAAEPEVGAVAVPKPVADALLRFRVIAYIVGVGLIVLVFVGLPLKYAGDVDGVVAVVGPLHGALYVIYLLATIDLARRIRLSPVTTVLVMLAGTIPFLSFVAERKLTHFVMGPGEGPHAA